MRCARAGSSTLALDLGDARIVRGVLAGVALDARARSTGLVAALAAKDARRACASCRRRCPEATRTALLTLLTLYGGVEVLDAARRELPRAPLIDAALDDLAWLAAHVRRDASARCASASTWPT